MLDGGGACKPLGEREFLMENAETRATPHPLSDKKSCGLDEAARSAGGSGLRPEPFVAELRPFFSPRTDRDSIYAVYRMRLSAEHGYLRFFTFAGLAMAIGGFLAAPKFTVGPFRSSGYANFTCNVRTKFAISISRLSVDKLINLTLRNVRIF
ncbi:hypothetical protein NQ317_005141, partial [Molorchus minor]